MIMNAHDLMEIDGLNIGRASSHLLFNAGISDTELTDGN